MIGALIGILLVVVVLLGALCVHLLFRVGALERDLSVLRTDATRTEADHGASLRGLSREVARVQDATFPLVQPGESGSVLVRDGGRRHSYCWRRLEIATEAPKPPDPEDVIS